MPRNPDPLLARHWAQRLRRFESTDATVAEFCRSEGVSSTAFYQWRRKLHDQPHGGDVSSPRFVPVQLVDEQPSDERQQDGIEIRLPNGALVRLPAATEANMLCQLVSHVAALPLKENRPC